MTFKPRETKGAPLTNAEIDTAFDTVDAKAQTGITNAATAQAAANAAQTTANAKPSLQSGVLASSPTLAPNATAVFNELASKASTADLTAKAGLQTGALAPSTTLAPNATAVVNALAGKSDALGNVDLGTVSASLNGTANGWRYNFWHGAVDTTLTLATGGAVKGMVISIGHEGATGLLTLSPVMVPTGYKNTLGPNEVGTLTYNGSAWLSNIPAPVSSGGGSGTVQATISGTRGTGNTLTAVLPAGAVSGSYQWQSQVSGTWTNVASGGTSATHVQLVADATRDIRCVVSNVVWGSNVLAAPAGGAKTKNFGRNTGNVGDLLIGAINPDSHPQGDITAGEMMVFYRAEGYDSVSGINATQVTGLDAAYATTDVVTAVKIFLFPIYGGGADAPGEEAGYSLEVYKSLKDMVVTAGSPGTPNKTVAKTGLAWDLQCAANPSTDRSARLSASPIQPVGGDYVIPSSVDLIAAFQAAISAGLDKVDLLLMTNAAPAGSGSYRLCTTAAAADGVRPYVQITIA